MATTILSCRPLLPLLLKESNLLRQGQVGQCCHRSSGILGNRMGRAALVGPAPTFLALIAIAPGLSNKSAEFTAEPLLLMLVVLTFYFVRGFEQPRFWALAGASAGFAYLTKGSGLLLLLAYALIGFRSAPKLILTPRFWLFPLVFVLVASPLLAYNWQVFGSPIFNYNTAHVIWLDYTEEQMIMFDKGLPTMSSYLATHSLADILHRFLRGLVRVRGVEWSGRSWSSLSSSPNGGSPTFRFPLPSNRWSRSPAHWC